MEPSYIEQLQEHKGLLADQLLNIPDVMVGNASLHSHALRMKACNHLAEDLYDGGRSPAHCKSSICGLCGRWRNEQVADRARFAAQSLQTNPKTIFKAATFTVQDVSTDEIRDTFKRLHSGWKNVIAPVKGVLGSICSMEVATSLVNPKLENVHIHALVALDSAKHSGKYYRSEKKWSKAWFDNVESARDVSVQTLPTAADVYRIIDYNIPTNDMKKGFLAQMYDAVKNPRRYVDRCIQLWNLPRHPVSGVFITPEMPKETGSGLWPDMTPERWKPYYAKVARGFGPITNQPWEALPVES